MLPAVALPFVGNPLTKTIFADGRPWVLLPVLARTFFRADRLILFFPLAFGLAAVAGVHGFVTQTDHWSYLKTIAWGFSDVGPLRYLASFFNAFGPLPLVVVFAAGFVPTFLKHHQMFAVILFTFLVISWSALGGERYFVWVIPIIFVMIGRVLERRFDVIHSWPIMATIVAFEVVAVRALFALPEYGPRTQLSIPREALARYLPDGWFLAEMNAYTAVPKTVLSSVVVTLLMGGVLWLAMRGSLKSRPPDS